MSVVLDAKINSATSLPAVVASMPTPFLSAELESEAASDSLANQNVPLITAASDANSPTLTIEGGGALFAAATPNPEIVTTMTWPSSPVTTFSAEPSALTTTEGARPDWVVALGAPLFLVAVWLALLYFISRRGWSSFAARYPAPRLLQPDKIVANQVSFGRMLGSYRWVVRIAFCDGGLYLATIPPFRAFHHPLLIPWDRVKSIKHKRSASSRYRIEIEDSAGQILLRLPATIGTPLRMVRPVAAKPTAQYG